MSASISSAHNGSLPSDLVSGSGLSSARKAGRETFGAFELAIVMSHYDIGVIEAVQDFPRGSRKSPKLVMRTDQGLFLLKRRARGKDDAYKVAFCHQLQLYLAAQQFPMPQLIGTKKNNNSLLQYDEAIYELFEYIKGTPYDQSLEATADAGKILALFHKLLLSFKSDYEPPRGSYHGSRSVNAALDRIPAKLAQTDPACNDMTHPVHAQLAYISQAYKQAAQRTEDAGLSEWPSQFVHSDWHTGNMLFRGSRVVAVIDYDTSRIMQRVIDIANGALQFSFLTGSEDPAKWPEYLDESRFKRFLRAYDDVQGCQLTKAELRVIPDLMIEALIAEAAIPIAATGALGRINGAAFIAMAQRKVQWIEQHTDDLANILNS